MAPTKLELLTTWLPSRPWYRGDHPNLTKAGGFRLDDPAGAVGIEFMVVTDVSAAPTVTYLVPMTYRDAPLPAAEHALIGTSEHGVLGTRWIYDAAHDPVFIGQTLALVAGRAHPQAQSESDTPDLSVSVKPGEITIPATGFEALTVTDERSSTAIAAGEAAPLFRIHRVLDGSDPTEPHIRVEAPWTTSAGVIDRAVFLSA